MDAGAPESAPGASGAGPIVRFAGIGKRFPGVQALRDISFEIMPGSCHALCGENGAGKSTLSKILAGILQPDAGEIRVRGLPVSIDTPTTARDLGIGMVFQELDLFPNLTVAENLAAMNRAAGEKL